MVDVLGAQLYEKIDLVYFTDAGRTSSILAARETFRGLPEAERTALVAEYGSEGAAILLRSLDGGDLPNQSTVAGATFNGLIELFDRTEEAAGAAGVVIGTTRGTVQGFVQTVDGVVKVVLNPRESLRELDRLITFARENPEAFVAALGQAALTELRSIQSDYNNLLYAVAIERRSTLTNNPDGLLAGAISEFGTQPRLIYNTTEQLSSRVGPYLIGLLTAGTGAVVLRGGRIADAIITNVRRAERLVNGRGPDADAPNTPGTPDTDAPNTPRTDPERDGGGDAGRTNPPDTDDTNGNPNPNNVDGNGNGDGRAPETGNNGGNGLPDIRVERIDVNNVQRGTREFELLNNPPPNTRIELSNGNVYVTNAQGIVDEVSFQPRLVTGTRDARQTAVGREGLDTDVGGHIQACSLGGTCDRVNLFPQDRTFNNSEYRTFENDIRRALEAKENVGPVTVRFIRPDPANPRPTSVEVTYTINGQPTTIPFRNERGGGL